MDQDELNRNVIEELHSIHSILKKLTNQDYCHRALLMAMAEQPSLNAAKLEADYEDNLQHILEQIPPDLQQREIYETYFEGLQMRLANSRGKPYSG